MNILITGALGHIGSGLIENVTKIKNLKNIYLLDSARSNNLNVLFNLRAKKTIARLKTEFAKTMREENA